MKPMKAWSGRALPQGSKIHTCDNSGAKELRIIAIIHEKTVKNRMPGARIGDLIQASVKKGEQDMRKKVVFAVIVRQKQSYRRPDGSRIQFSDNSAVVMKDEKGNPKGTIFKGPIAKEAAERWPGIAKLAEIVV